jgi:soluble lytic murein transglycosylase-like protein
MQNNDLNIHHRQSKVLKNFKNKIIMVILIICFIFGGISVYLTYDAYINTKQQLSNVQLSLLELRESISINDQRHAKIQNATNIILKYNSINLPKNIAVKYAAWYVDEAEKYPNYDYKLTLAIDLVESHFDKTKIGSSGELGVGQLMRYTALSVAKDLEIDAYTDSLRADTKTNIMISTKYLYDMLVDCDNNLEFAIASYNGGPQTNYKQWKKGKLIKSEVPNVTLKYVPQVLAYYNQFIKDELLFQIKGT